MSLGVPKTIVVEMNESVPAVVHSRKGTATFAGLSCVLSSLSV